MTETAVIPDIDPAEVEQAAGQLVGILTGGMLSHMIDIGARTNLFDALAAGPATSVELADRAGLTERYVREWLGALVTGGIVQYEPSTKPQLASQCQSISRFATRSRLPGRYQPNGAR